MKRAKRRGAGNESMGERRAEEQRSSIPLQVPLKHWTGVKSRDEMLSKISDYCEAK